MAHCDTTVEHFDGEWTMVMQNCSTMKLVIISWTNVMEKRSIKMRQRRQMENGQGDVRMRHCYEVGEHGDRRGNHSELTMQYCDRIEDHCDETTEFPYYTIALYYVLYNRVL